MNQYIDLLLIPKAASEYVRRVYSDLAHSFQAHSTYTMWWEKR